MHSIQRLKWNVRDRAAFGREGYYRVGVLLHARSDPSGQT